MLKLVRHAESCANVGSISSDYAAIPLTAWGQIQAAEFAEPWMFPPPWFGVSPFLRAQQTAAHFRQRFPDVPVVELPVQEFTYIAPARCASMSPAELKEYTDAYWDRLDPDYNDGPGAESFNEFLHRAETFLTFVASRPDMGIVFTHAQFIRAILLLSIPELNSGASRMESFFSLRKTISIPNASITRIEHGQYSIATVSNRVCGPKPNTEHVKGVPMGTYCYGYVPRADSGFTDTRLIDAHIEGQQGKLGDMELHDLYFSLVEVRHCKYWHPTDHGFVECRYLNQKALWITTTDEIIDKAIAYFGSEEEMDKQIDGWLLGDGVKACQLNRDGPDWAIEPETP